MASGTGVGGIKDSQGNYSIIGKSDCQIGTRGGTLVVPVGDVSGQTPGRLLVNTVLRQDVPEDMSVRLNVSSFEPGTSTTPPGLPVLKSFLALGTEDNEASSSPPDFGVFRLEAANDEGISLRSILSQRTLTLKSSQDVSIVAETGVLSLSCRTFIPPQEPLTEGLATLEGVFLVRRNTSASETISFYAPCQGFVSDVMAIVNSNAPPPNDEVVISREGTEICRLPSGSGFIRRATQISEPASANGVVGFQKDDLFRVDLPTGRQGQTLVKIYFVRIV